MCTTSLAVTCNRLVLVETDIVCTVPCWVPMPVHDRLRMDLRMFQSKHGNCCKLMQCSVYFTTTRWAVMQISKSKSLRFLQEFHSSHALQSWAYLACVPALADQVKYESSRQFTLACAGRSFARAHADLAAEMRASYDTEDGAAYDKTYSDPFGGETPFLLRPSCLSISQQRLVAFDIVKSGTFCVQGSCLDKNF